MPSPLLLLRSSKRALYRVVAMLATSLMALQVQAVAPVVSHDESNEAFDLIVRSEIEIDRPVREVWGQFLDMGAWMAGLRFQNIEGLRGEEGEVRLVTQENSVLYSAYFIKTVRVTPYRQFVVRVTPQTGNDYFGFADFSFDEIDGRTHLIYDIYVETKVPRMSEAEFSKFASEQYASARNDVARNNLKLKSLVEAKR